MKSRLSHERLAGAPERLALLRLSAIGDTCHVVPLVRTLQAVWPNTGLTWIVGRTEAGLVGDIAGVDFIRFDKSKGFAAFPELRRQLHGSSFDVLLHLQAALRASMAARLVSARVKLGYDRTRAKDFQWLFTNARIDAPPRLHVLDAMFGFLEALGIYQRVLRWDIPIPAAAEAYVEDVIPAGPLLVISPCSSDRFNNFRNWPAERYAAVADIAATRHGLQIAITGGNTELERWYGEEISRQMKSGRPHNLVGKTSLKQLLALLRRATALVSPDSGPAHMATTVGTPVVGLYASSNPQRTGPYLGREWLVNRYPEAALAAFGAPVEALPWGKRVRVPEVMERITIEDVEERLHALAAAKFPRTLPEA